MQHDRYEIYLEKYFKNIQFVDRTGKTIPKPAYKSKLLLRPRMPVQSDTANTRSDESLEPYVSKYVTS